MTILKTIIFIMYKETKSHIQMEQVTLIVVHMLHGFCMNMDIQNLRGTKKTLPGLWEVAHQKWGGQY